MGDRVTVLFIAAWTLVTAVLGYSVPARAQNELYDTSQTVTIEGDVAGFVVGDEYATVSMFPVGEPKNSRTMWVVDWRGGTSLSGQGITADWLKSGDRVVVTGHPYRIAGQRQMLLETITRGSDGRKWARGQAASTSSASQGSGAGGAAAHSQAAQTQSAGAPAGPAWEHCKSGLRSGASQTAVQVEFLNSSKQPRKLIWFDFAGAKIVAGILQPGQRAPMQTYMTHAWMIADGSDRCLGTLVITKTGSIEIR